MLEPEPEPAGAPLLEHHSRSDSELAAALAKIEAQHQQALKTAWQHHKFNSNQQLKYDKYAMKYQHGYWNNYGDSYGDCGYGYGW